ncbi:hypothetical protein PRZ48_002121 [Zasmidium cellare]|uniref:Uncharacterized protein n=1 Tax=Zasmidium cellare TaxID=395010 RepID=A0ABR0F4H2_ZASCE|nr:hypothetical protein PRZ48_002121 [Zasmidium cellare]
MPNSNTPHGARGSQQRATSNSGNTSNYGSVSTANATNGGSAGGRSDYGQQPFQGMQGGAYPGYYANGGYQQPNGMSGNPQSVPFPYNDPNLSRSAGYGPTLGQEGDLGRLDTLVPARGPVRVPIQQQQHHPPTSAGGYAPGAGSPYPPQNPAVNGQPAVNGTNTQSGNTHRYPTPAPRQSRSGPHRRGDDYRRQQGPSSSSGRSGY